MLNMQNVKDIEITEGKVRTIHDKDNRLLWGRLNYDTKYAGDTYQQTYSGKNLFPLGTGSYTNHGITSVYNSDGSITVSGTADATYADLTTNRIVNYEQDKTYTASITEALPCSFGMITLETGTQREDIIINVGTKSGKRTFSYTHNIAKLYIYNLTVGQSYNFTVYPMVEEGSTATPFEPYTGGIPAPNPDYPQDVQVVTGEQTVTVTGKNLFDTSLATTIKSGASASLITDGIRVTSTASGLWKFVSYNVLEAKDYIGKTITFSCKMKTSSNNDTRMYIGLSNASGTDRSQKASLNSTGSVSYTVEEDANRPYVCIALYANNNVSSQAGVYTDFTDIQLEVGASATPFQPYQGQSYTIDLGPTELCKIGDYQDYIYKSGDDWYVHKECSKYTFTGSETGQIYSPTSTYTEARFYGNYGEIGPTSNKTTISTKFAYLNNNRVAVISGYNSNNWYVRIPSSFNVTTLEEMRTYVTNNTTYYPLATPTDTQITDATLVGQLNAVHEWLTRYGYNATVTGNLPIIISKTNL